MHKIIFISPFKMHYIFPRKPEKKIQVSPVNLRTFGLPFLFDLIRSWESVIPPIIQLQILMDEHFQVDYLEKFL